jgi:hypothetical protein
MLKANSLGDAGKIRKHASEAGFSDANIRTTFGTARFPSARHFVEALTAGGVASRHAMSKVPENQRSAYLGEVSGALRRFEDKDGVTLPLGYLVLVARP